MTGEAKVMWSGRLPGALVDQIKEAAAEDQLSEAEVVEPILAEAMDQRQLARDRDRT
jgi:hypothetical protein